MSWACQTLEDTVKGLEADLEALQDELSMASPSFKASLVSRIGRINSELTPLRREYNDCIQTNPKPSTDPAVSPATNEINIVISFNDFDRNNTIKFVAVYLTVVIDLVADSHPERVQVRRRSQVNNSWSGWHVMDVGNIGEEWVEGQLTDKYWVNLFYAKRLNSIQYEVRHFSESQWGSWKNRISM